MALDLKICGLKTPEALATALAEGATHVGFIFFPRSPRNVLPAEAGRLRTFVPTGSIGGRRVKVVAVTVDADDVLLDNIVTTVNPDMLQLHGSEPPERVAALKARYGLPTIKAFAIASPADLDGLAPYRGVADRFLLDAKPPRGAPLPGGNGVSFDWSLLREIDPSIDYFLSGGLTAANVGAALAVASPSGLDVSSGVESSPGVKDAALIKAFSRAVKAATNRESA